MEDGSYRIKNLDGLRGIAILMVMFFHLAIVIKPETLLGTYIRQFLLYGWTGVDLFFVLSGFLITSILLKTKNKSGYFKNFYIRRILRIMPLYYTFLGLFFVITLFTSNSEVLGVLKEYTLHSLTYTLNLHFTPSSNVFIDLPYISHLWSLAVEEQFYLIWPLIVLLLSPLALLICIIFIFILALFLRLQILDGAEVFGIHAINYTGMLVFINYTNLFTRADAFVMGAFVALVHLFWPHFLYKSKNLFIGIVFILGTLTTYLVLDGKLMLYESLFPHTYGYTLSALFFGAIIVLALISNKQSFISKILSSKALRECGKYSYAIYIYSMYPYEIFYSQIKHLLHLPYSPKYFYTSFLLYCLQ